jgi:hypothetical protein
MSQILPDQVGIQLAKTIKCIVDHHLIGPSKLRIGYRYVMRNVDDPWFHSPQIRELNPTRNGQCLQRRPKKWGLTDRFSLKFTQQIARFFTASPETPASVPAGFTPEGLPVGIQIVGRQTRFQRPAIGARI